MRSFVLSGGLLHRLLRDHRIWLITLAVVMGIAMISSWQAQHPSSDYSGSQHFGGVMSGTAGGLTPHGSALMTNFTTAASSSSIMQNSATRVHATTPVASTINRKVILQANLSVTVRDVQRAKAHLSSITMAVGGFIESSQQFGSSTNPTVTMQLRIPEQDFAHTIHSIQSLGTVTSFSQTGQDVTQQFNSDSQQLAELRSEEAAYARLFAKAQSMKDMLTIQGALIQVQNQVANLTGQQNDLSRAAHLSTVTITLTPPVFANTAPAPIVTAWQQVVSAIGSSALAVLTMIAWIVPWAVSFAVIVAVVWLVARIRRSGK